MWRITLSAVAMLLAAPAGAQTVSVQVSPASASLIPSQSEAFTATVSGSSNGAVTWLVNGVRGGAPSTGIISAAGLYTAPADPASALAVSVQAIAAAAPTSEGSASVSVAAATPSGPTYYVAAKGANTPSGGTQAAPWQTVQYAVDQVSAGATILVETGVYNELVTITQSGSAAAGFISLEAAPGQSPVIDGTGLKIPTGQNGLVTINNASYIRVKGFEIRNYKTGTLQVPIGIYVEGAGSYIELLSNYVHDIVTTVKSSEGDALGIAVYGVSGSTPISWLTIDGNELANLTTGFSESLSLSGNVENFEINNNLIHNNDNIGINIEGFFGTAKGSPNDQARQGLVAGNHVYAISSLHNPAYKGSPSADGIYVDGGANVTIQQNVVNNSDIGIEIASEVPGKATSQVLAHDNLIYRSLVTGISIGGATALKNGGTQDCVIANNTLYFNDTTQSGSGEFQVQYNASDNIFANNILSANSQGLFVRAPAKVTTEPASLNNNIYYVVPGNTEHWNWLGKSYTGFAAYKTGSGQDSASVVANPRFVAPAKSNFNLDSTSPAIAFGQNLGPLDIGAADAAGQARTLSGTVDAGAYEH